MGIGIPRKLLGKVPIPLLWLIVLVEGSRIGKNRVGPFLITQAFTMSLLPSISAEACSDQDEKYCKKWAPKGYCKTSFTVMTPKCKKSCKMCEPGNGNAGMLHG